MHASHPTMDHFVTEMCLCEYFCYSMVHFSATNLELLGVIFTLFCAELHFNLNYRCNTLFEDKKSIVPKAKTMEFYCKICGKL